MLIDHILLDKTHVASVSAVTVAHALFDDPLERCLHVILFLFALLWMILGRLTLFLTLFNRIFILVEIFCRRHGLLVKVRNGLDSGF